MAPAPAPYPNPTPLSDEDNLALSSLIYSPSPAASSFSTSNTESESISIISPPTSFVPTSMSAWPSAVDLYSEPGSESTSYFSDSNPNTNHLQNAPWLSTTPTAIPSTLIPASMPTTTSAAAVSSAPMATGEALSPLSSWDNPQTLALRVLLIISLTSVLLIALIWATCGRTAGKGLCKGKKSGKENDGAKDEKNKTTTDSTTPALQPCQQCLCYSHALGLASTCPCLCHHYLRHVVSPPAVAAPMSLDPNWHGNREYGRKDIRIMM